MNLIGKLRRLAARPDPTLQMGAPVEMEHMDIELSEVQAVRNCIAKVVEFREAHALVIGRRDVLVQELNQSLGERTALQAKLAARERQIAFEGGEIPSEPWAEEAGLSVLGRRVRIQQERVAIAEGKVRESQSELDTTRQIVEESWRALGAVISDRLLAEFREAATALRDAQLGYLALWHYFCAAWESSSWKHFDRKLAIADPMSWGLILDPRVKQATSVEEMMKKPPVSMPTALWPPSAQALLKDMVELRAEIDAVK